jgi:hypothetical protein
MKFWSRSQTSPVSACVMTVTASGDKEWRNGAGELHREDGPAVECANGDRAWFFRDRLHRVNGPAVEHTGVQKSWYRHGVLHREDGPAIEGPGNNKAWFLDGVRLSDWEIEALEEKLR